MKYDPRQAGEERRARRREEDRRPYLERLAASRLKPLDFRETLSIRRQDIAVFRAAAAAFDHIIIVRATNQQSLAYVGRKGFAPKPIDCKPKTADAHTFAAGHQVYSAGLVVDPTLTGDGAFLQESKRQSARDAWKGFLKDKTPAEIEQKVFWRRGSSGGMRGFFAVDTYLTSEYYGCLMVSEQERPSRDFRLSVQEWQDFKQKHMAYIHGDYDLYGLIDMSTDEKVVHDGMLRGIRHVYTHRFPEIQEFLNNGIGAAMVQHGAQDNLGHQDDELYVFTPLGAYWLRETADAIREIYELVWGQGDGFVVRK
ncbi:MAG: hypothetical protein J5I93_19205 [Pirellulaceae bacterium]|nr:hypothetical protein [Pirellulaceae bacterium]